MTYDAALYYNQQECDRVLELKEQGFTHKEALQQIEEEEYEYLDFLNSEDLERC